MLLYFSPLQVGRPFWYDPAYATVLPLFLLGTALALARREVHPLLSLVPVVATLATTVVVLAMPRYRLPAEPGMVIVACNIVPDLARRLGKERVRGILGAIVLVNGVLAVLFFSP